MNKFSTLFKDCRKCEFLDTASCPFSKLVLHPITNILLGHKTDNSEIIFCKKFERRKKSK